LPPKGRLRNLSGNTHKKMFTECSSCHWTVHLKMVRTGAVAQWYGVCQVCTRPQVQPLALHPHMDG
jgi:hypothetical protein